MNPSPAWATRACTLWLTAAAIAVGAGGTTVAADKRREPAPPELMARVGAYVQRYVDRARWLLSRETSRTRELAAGLTPIGGSRVVVSEQRVEWNDDDPQQEPTIVREIVQVQGRTPKPGDEPNCYDPKATSPEPLGFLLPERQAELAFEMGGSAKIDRRPTVIVEFRPVQAAVPSVSWKGTCSTIDLGSQVRGRFWTDPETGEILKLEWSLARSFEFALPKDEVRPGMPRHQTLDMWTYSVRYTPVPFAEPAETMLLPSTINSVTVFRYIGTTRVMTQQQFSNYRRFMTRATLLTK